MVSCCRAVPPTTEQGHICVKCGGEFAIGLAGPGTASRRRDCHFADALSSVAIERPTKGRGGCSRMTVSPAARHRPHRLCLCPAGRVGPLRGRPLPEGRCSRAQDHGLPPPFAAWPTLLRGQPLTLLGSLCRASVRSGLAARSPTLRITSGKNGKHPQLDLSIMIVGMILICSRLIANFGCFQEGRSMGARKSRGEMGQRAHLRLRTLRIHRAQAAAAAASLLRLLLFRALRAPLLRSNKGLWRHGYGCGRTCVTRQGSSRW